MEINIYGMAWGHRTVYGMAWRASHGIWLWSGRQGMGLGTYCMPWWALHGVWYGLADKEWCMVWPPIFCRSRQCTPVHLARDLLGTRHQCYGTPFQTILENVQILIILKVLFYHGMVKIVIV